MRDATRSSPPRSRSPWSRAWRPRRCATWRRAMGTSSGLIHHYFASMDDVLAAAFERVGDAGPRAVRGGSWPRPPPRSRRLRVFFRTYTPADKDWAFQLWLDAWAEAARRPAVQATSRRLNLEWQALLERTIEAGVASGAFRVPDPGRRRVADPVAARRAGAPGRGARDDDQPRRRRRVVDRRGGARIGAGRGSPALGEQTCHPQFPSNVARRPLVSGLARIRS